MRIFIFGADSYGANVCEGLRLSGIEPIGFVTLQANESRRTVKGLPVYLFDEITYAEYDRILIPHAPDRGSAVMNCCRKGLLFGRDYQFTFGEDFFVETKRAIVLAQRLIKYAKERTPNGIHEARTLHVGAGKTIEMDLLLLAEGAREAKGIDLAIPSNYPEITVEYKALRHILMESKDKALTCLIPQLEKFVHDAGSHVCVNTSYVQYYPFTMENIPTSLGEFNIIHSNAVFEHIVDPKQLLQKLTRLTTVGGLAFHVIDLRDHINNDCPYTHLTQSKEEWCLSGQNIKAGYLRSNRWRGIDYVTELENNGFEIISYEKIYPEEAILHTFPQNIHPDFMNYELDELTNISCIIGAIKK